MLSVEVEDLTCGSSTPKDQLAQNQARVAAARGIDVLVFAPACWTVCSSCNLPSHSVLGASVCCVSPVRIQGWSL